MKDLLENWEAFRERFNTLSFEEKIQITKQLNSKRENKKGEKVRDLAFQKVMKLQPKTKEK